MCIVHEYIDGSAYVDNYEEYEMKPAEFQGMIEDYEYEAADVDAEIKRGALLVPGNLVDVKLVGDEPLIYGLARVKSKVYSDKDAKEHDKCAGSGCPDCYEGYIISEKDDSLYILLLGPGKVPYICQDTLIEVIENED